jgi:hypothetical protein
MQKFTAVDQYAQKLMSCSDTPSPMDRLLTPRQFVQSLIVTRRWTHGEYQNFVDAHEKEVTTARKVYEDLTRCLGDVDPYIVTLLLADETAMSAFAFFLKRHVPDLGVEDADALSIIECTRGSLFKQAALAIATQFFFVC